MRRITRLEIKCGGGIFMHTVNNLKKMDKNKRHKIGSYDSKDVASDYDNLVRQHKWHVPEMIYNYFSKFVQRHTKLLNIGVATGISSERFHDNQVELYGLDNSTELPEICKTKGIFNQVRLFDLSEEQFPHPDLTFDHVVCTVVFHFFSDLEHIFKNLDIGETLDYKLIFLKKKI